MAKTKQKSSKKVKGLSRFHWIPFKNLMLFAFIALFAVGGLMYVNRSYALTYYWPSYGSCDWHTVSDARNSTGPCVKYVQWALMQDDSRGNNDIPYDCGAEPNWLKIDGIFGPLTDANVRNFQRGHYYYTERLAVDGVVGPKTWWALKYYKYKTNLLDANCS